ncbi:MAG: hypothetical protein L6437_10225 [Kiritimatiellae bacterium]|nr:hypothetical protein [Verrucomicrobiota bacterium]MBU4286139.1 hypothetical protein [Verrucomicrobiota bacterium]MBU4365893.1 hypothetical protein [Verrucomicrobiota bacterium]MCG2660607.1 hypothetical protein [Kiritimatiellia bacterium]
MHTKAVPDIDPLLWKNPPMEFRPVPFWVWNEKQEPDELRRQIHDMKEHGFGGFFMHARIGLKTPYLGDAWFENVRLSVAEAKRLGMKAWIYDEDRWSSGFASGKIDEVPGLDYALAQLICREQNGERSIEVVRSPKRVGQNNASDPDVLNAEVVAAFIRLTHAEYEKHVGGDFAGAVPGTFMDEPNYVMWRHHEFQGVPWTAGLEAEFEKRRGYSLKPHRASLFFNEGDYRRVRIDFYRTVTEMFVNAFPKQIYDWCRQRGLVSTGHMLSEESLLSQVQAIGAAMPHYEYFQMPGIDHLGYALTTPLLQKQCSSVARQLGRVRVLSELFGACGWETAIGMLKPGGDYDYALGINFLNQHLAYYSIRGCRKRDYPTSCSYHLPGYELYKPFNDYYARLSLALAQGQAVSRILVLHPISSAWVLYTPRDTLAVKALDQEFLELCRCLHRIQLDYDFGDEMLMERYGKIEPGTWVIGEARYQAVIVPSAENWSGNTFRLMREFEQMGGLVITVGRRASCLDGRLSDELAQFWNRPALHKIETLTEKALDRALDAVARDIEVTDKKSRRIRELIYQHRCVGEKDIYFLTFGGIKKACTAFVSLEGEGAVETWDAIQGTIHELPAQNKKGRTLFELQVPARGSQLIVLNRNRKPQTGLSSVARESVREPLGGPWKLSRLNPNSMIIERCRVRFGQSPWSEPMGIAGGGGIVAMPNAHDLLEQAFEKNYIWPTWPVHLRFEFKARLIDGVPPNIRLVIENSAAMTDFYCNGQPVSVTTTDWWLDRQFRTMDLKGLVVNGRNKIDCLVKWVKPIISNTLRFTPDGVELENVYLIGDFHVTCKGLATGIIPDALLPDDPGVNLTKRGLPFYAGTIRYEKDWTVPDIQPGRKYCLRFPCPNGDGIKLSVNGNFVRHLWCEPFEADCTAFLKPGVNRIQADIFSTLNNAVGMLHHKAPWSDSAHALAQYILRPLGMNGVPEMIRE